MAWTTSTQTVTQPWTEGAAQLAQTALQAFGVMNAIKQQKQQAEMDKVLLPLKIQHEKAAVENILAQAQERQAKAQKEMREEKGWEEMMKDFKTPNIPVQPSPQEFMASVPEIAGVPTQQLMKTSPTVVQAAYQDWMKKTPDKMVSPIEKFVQENPDLAIPIKMGMTMGGKNGAELIKSVIASRAKEKQEENKFKLEDLKAEYKEKLQAQRDEASLRRTLTAIDEREAVRDKREKRDKKQEIQEKRKDALDKDYRSRAEKLYEKYTSGEIKKKVYLEQLRSLEDQFEAAYRGMGYKFNRVTSPTGAEPTLQSGRPLPSF